MTEDTVATTEAVTAVVERVLGESPTDVESVEEGLLHETYVIESAGAGYVLQFASPASDDRADSLARGLACYRLLAETAVPVPTVVTPTVRCHDGRRYTLVERLPGTTGERDVSPARTRNAGRCLARVHGVWNGDRPGWLRVEEGRPAVDSFPESDLQRRVRHEAARSARILRAADLGTAANAVEDAVARACDRLPEPGRPVLRHGDYSPDNVLFRGDEVTGVLDFDRATVGHPVRDLVQGATAFWMHDPCADWAPRTAFYEGYRAERGVPDGFDRVEPLYRVLTLADTVAGMLDLGEYTDSEREFYAERLVAAADRVEQQ